MQSDRYARIKERHCKDHVPSTSPDMLKQYMRRIVPNQAGVRKLQLIGIRQAYIVHATLHGAAHPLLESSPAITCEVTDMARQPAAIIAPIAVV